MGQLKKCQMKCLITVLFAITIAGLFTQCKKNSKKLENPFGLLLLGSDTSLPDGRYVIRTKSTCGGVFNTLRCDDADEVLDMNGNLIPVDHISLLEVDTHMVWYVKKVRYVSPDPDYALAFGYRIYQYRPKDRPYRIFGFSATAGTRPWTDDEVGDGGGKSVTAGTSQYEKYPGDPAVPTGFGTDTSTTPQINSYTIFQFYPSKNTPGAWILKAGGYKANPGDPVDRWKFCTAYWDEDNCDGHALPPHFRSESSHCERIDDGSQRCYIDEFVFQKAY